MNPEYEVVFNLETAGVQFWWMPLPGLAFIAIGLIGLRHKWGRNSATETPLRRAFVIGCSLFWFGFFLLWTIGVSFAVFGEYFSVKSALKRGQFEIVEGKVTDFDPMPWEGHKFESFVVNGHRYKYSDFVVTCGFNNTTSHGGPIREGLQLRITDVRGVIAKLEIAKETKSDVLARNANPPRTAPNKVTGRCCMDSQ
jgi:hypothetical protein